MNQFTLVLNNQCFTERSTSVDHGVSSCVREPGSFNIKNLVNNSRDCNHRLVETVIPLVEFEYFGRDPNTLDIISKLSGLKRIKV